MDSQPMEEFETSAKRRRKAPSSTSAKRVKKEAITTRLINIDPETLKVAPVVARKKGARKKRGSSVRVAMRNRLRQQRILLRSRFSALKKKYQIEKRKLDRDINSLYCTSAGRYIDKKSGAYMA